MTRTRAASGAQGGLHVLENHRADDGGLGRRMVWLLHAGWPDPPPAGCGGVARRHAPDCEATEDRVRPLALARRTPSTQMSETQMPAEFVEADLKRDLASLSELLGDMRLLYRQQRRH